MQTPGGAWEYNGKVAQASGYSQLAPLSVKATERTQSVAVDVEVEVLVDVVVDVDVDVLELVDVDVVVNSTVISHDTISKSTVNLITGVLNLQAGDVLKIQADTANKITGVVSFLRIDRSQENG